MKISSVALILLSILINFSHSSKNVVCYFTSWTTYRNGVASFNVANVDGSLCTHIVYAFVGLSDSGHLLVLDEWEAFGLEEIAHLVDLKRIHKGLKVLLGVGGWNECETNKYSVVAADPGKRATLIADVVAFLGAYGFDGLDLDWEYPAQRAGKPEDKANFVQLLNELGTALHAKRYILTAAVAGGVASTDASYDVKAVSNALDLINVMTYDFNGAWAKYVGHNAPLFASHLDTTPEQRQGNVAGGIQNWLDKGADPRKINLGVATYGRSFTLADPSNPQLYAPVNGPGRGGNLTWLEGMLGFHEICMYRNHWPYFWDDEQKAPHRAWGDQWVGYDDQRSLTMKAEFALDKGLGGIMVWSMDTDDFSGLCGPEKFPLLRTVNRALGRL